MGFSLGGWMEERKEGRSKERNKGGNKQQRRDGEKERVGKCFLISKEELNSYLQNVEHKQTPMRKYDTKI
jgi:hypothetical protein